MLFRKSSVGFIAMALCLIVFAPGHARADVISYSSGFSLNNLSNYDDTTANSYGTRTLSDNSTETSSVQLDRFDASLGTLTDVELSFTSSFDHVSFGYAFDPNAYRSTHTYSYSCGWFRTCTGYYYRYHNDTFISGSASANLSIDLIDPSGAAASVYDSNTISCSNSYSYSTYGYSTSCSDTENDNSNAFSSVLNTGGIALSAFIGTDPLDLLLRNTAGFSAICDYDGSGYDYCRAYNDVYWSGTLTVAYTYDIAQAVPAPGTLSLFGLALLGMGLSQGRLRRA